MTPGKRQSLPHLRQVFLVTVIAICLLCNLGILFSVDIVTRDRLQRNVVADLGIAAAIASARVEQQLEERYLAIEALADALGKVSSRADGEALINAAFTRSQAYFGIFYQTPAGATSAGSVDARVPPAVRTGGEPLVQELPLRTVGEGNAAGDLIAFGLPVRSPEGTLKGVLGATLSKDWFAESLVPSSLRLGDKKGIDLSIVNRDGLVIIGSPSLLGTVLADLSSVPDGQLWNGPGRMLGVAAEIRGVSPVPALGWRVVVSGDAAQLFSLVETVRRTILFASIPVLLFCVLIAYLLVRKVAGPIEALTAALDHGRDIPDCGEFSETAKLAAALREAFRALGQEKERVELEVVRRTAELDDLLRVVNAHDIISMADEHGVILDCNDQFCLFSGYTRDEVIGQTYDIIRSDRHSPEFFETLEQTVNNGQIWRGLICNRSKSGELYWMQSTISPSGGMGDSNVRRISIRTDITAMINDRQKLAKMTSELLMFRRIIDHTTDGVSVMDRNGRYIYCNPARERMTGVPLSELKNRVMGDGLPDSAAGVNSEIKQAISAGRFWSGPLPFFGPDGKEFISASNVGVVTGEDGLPQFIFNIFQDQTSRLAHTKELEDARTAAEEANKAKSEFLSNMSHELRTPLNAILGFAQVLLIGRKNPLDEKQNQQVQQIIRGGEHLLGLINEVLDMAKIEAGHLTLSIEPILAAELLDECAALAQPVMERYQVALEGCQSSDLSAILADRVRTKQVLLNLLSNAAKYNKPGGTVTLSCERLEDGYIRFNISDTGIGIPQDKLQDLFTPFCRLGAEQTEIEGTGIGLALSKKLTEAMNGRIGVESGVGAGSRFWLDFPVTEREAGEPLGRRFVPAVLRKGEEASEPGVLVLYIEDNPSNIRLMESIFDTLPNMFLVTAMSAELGLDLALSVMPSLIIMDVNLPGMSGIEAVQLLKRHESTAAIPVIALSADATLGTMAKGIKAGFNAYLTKPVDVTRLIQQIKTFLGNAHG